MAEIFQKSSIRNVSYLPPDWAPYTSGANFGCRYAMYYPAGDRPPGGWPLSIQFRNTSFSLSTDAYADNDDEPISNANGEENQWYALKMGWALMYAQIPGYTATVIAADDYDGTTPITGGTKNLFHPPGNLRRYYEGGTIAAIEANGGKAYVNNYSAAVMAIQYARFHANLLGINPEMIDVGGISGGACTAGWLAFAPNRAGELGQGGQYEMNTVPNSCHIIDMVFASLAHYVTTFTLMQNLPTAEGATPDTAFTKNTTLADVPARIIDQSSVWSYLPGFTDDHIPPCVWQVGENTVPEPHFTEPFRTNAGTVGHDPWHGFVMRNRFPKKINFWVSTPVDTAFPKIASGLHDGILNDVGEVSTGLVPFEPQDGIIPTEFLKRWRANMGRPRWDSVMPPGGIRRRGQVEGVGRVVVPANPLRKGVQIFCRPGGPSLLVGEGQSEATYEVLPGEKTSVPIAGHLWMKSSSATTVALYDTREVE